MKPHAWQTKFKADYFRLGGGWCGIEPGGGKTYAAAAIASECDRPLVICPAGVMAQTRAMFESYGVDTYEPLREDGRGVAFISYTMMCRKEQADFLEQDQPTDILLDEAHKVANIGTNSAGKRLNRYLIAHPEVRVAWFTGSPMDGDPLDLVHGLRYALRGPAAVPGLPQSRDAMERWAGRMEDPEFRQRFLTTLKDHPGVVLVGDAGSQYDGRVELTVHRLPPVLTLPDDWVMPDGYALSGPAEAAAVERCLAWGFWETRVPRYSERYMEARREWSAVARRVIRTGAADTDEQVRALRPEAWAEFQRAEADEPPGARCAKWSPEGLDETSRFMAQIGPQRFQVMMDGGPRTIVWADSVALQAELALVRDVPWHHAKGMDERGVRLDQTDAPLVVASQDACSEGFNAQRNFNHNWVLQPPASSARFRQLIARTARQGQPKPVVTVHIVVRCDSDERALTNAIRGAIVDWETLGRPSPLLQLRSI